MWTWACKSRQKHPASPHDQCQRVLGSSFGQVVWSHVGLEIPGDLVACWHERQWNCIFQHATWRKFQCLGTKKSLGDPWWHQSKGLHMSQEYFAMEVVRLLSLLLLLPYLQCTNTIEILFISNQFEKALGPIFLTRFLFNFGVQFKDKFFVKTTCAKST